METWSRSVVIKASLATGAAVAAASLWLFWRRYLAAGNGKKVPRVQEVPSLADELREALAREAEESLASPEEEFEAATAWVNQNGGSLSNEVKLAFYGCYKQASAGDCKGNQPWAIEASMKWSAWNAMKGSSKDFAMRRYVALLDQLAPAWRSGAGAPDEDEDEEQAANQGKGEMSLGPSVSVMRSSIGDPNQAADVDETPVGQLCEKIAEGDTEAARAILRANPKLACQADKDGMIPLHWAADRGELEMVRALLAGPGVQANVNAKDASGETPLHYAVNTENVEVAQLLVSHGADVHVENEDGETPMQLAKEAGLDLKL
eukprot:TRINITY_DN28819_c0_g1_i1.p1 TRINITY_DN28819_c0_g1~~TRINITY_DN28819_c0_g1_i1.p1  ORF type:complete len:327 (-),score=76.81 TRINITY_DN28819_c0_g1_i1:142-1101(-)